MADAANTDPASPKPAEAAATGAASAKPAEAAATGAASAKPAEAAATGAASAKPAEAAATSAARVEKAYSANTGTASAKPAAAATTGAASPQPAESGDIGAASAQPAEAAATSAAGDKKAGTADIGSAGAQPAEAAATGTVRAKLADTITIGSASAISPEEVSALLDKPDLQKVRPYDFTTQRINRTQLPMLEIVSKSCADLMGVSLSTLIGHEATVHFTALDASKAGDLQAALPVPAGLLSVHLKPLPGVAFVTVEPTLLLALLDAFFGGSGRTLSDVQAAIAPAGQRFLTLMVQAFSADITAAWLPVTPLTLEVVKLETNPRLMHLGGPQDPMLVIKFTLEFGAQSGRMDWLIPESMLAPVREKLLSDGGAAPQRKTEAWAPLLRAALMDTIFETRAILAEAQISFRELVRLVPGDIIPIQAPQEVTLLVGDVPLFHGRFGVSQGRNSLKILAGGSA
jgi:flagellar motor switch protein FliM